MSGSFCLLSPDILPKGKLIKCVTMTDSNPDQRSDAINGVNCDTLVLGHDVPNVVIENSYIDKLVVCQDVEEIIITGSNVNFVSWSTKPKNIVIKKSTIGSPVPYAEKVYINDTVLEDWHLDGKVIQVKNVQTNSIEVNQCEELFVIDCPKLRIINVGCDLDYMLCENTGVVSLPSNIEEAYVENCPNLQIILDLQCVKATVMGCHQLRRIEAPNIKNLDCRNNVNLDDIYDLTKLRYLNATGCEKLSNLPMAYYRTLLIANTAVKKIPITAYGLKYLNCGNTAIKTVADFNYLTHLYVSKSEVAHIKSLPRLQHLVCRQSNELRNLENSTDVLEFFNMVGCENLCVITPEVNPNCYIKSDPQPEVQSSYSCVIM